MTDEVYQQIREFRLFRRYKYGKPSWFVQYGWWRPSPQGKTDRFCVHQEWPAPDGDEAAKLMEKLRIDVLLNPDLQPAPGARPAGNAFWRGTQLGRKHT